MVMVVLMEVGRRTATTTALISDGRRGRVGLDMESTNSELGRRGLVSDVGVVADLDVGNGLLDNDHGRSRFGRLKTDASLVAYLDLNASSRCLLYQDDGGVGLGNDVDSRGLISDIGSLVANISLSADLNMDTSRRMLLLNHDDGRGGLGGDYVDGRSLISDVSLMTDLDLDTGRSMLVLDHYDGRCGLGGNDGGGGLETDIGLMANLDMNSSGCVLLLYHDSG